MKFKGGGRLPRGVRRGFWGGATKGGGQVKKGLWEPKAATNIKNRV